MQEQLLIFNEQTGPRAPQSDKETRHGYCRWIPHLRQHKESCFPLRKDVPEICELTDPFNEVLEKQLQAPGLWHQS